MIRNNRGALNIELMMSLAFLGVMVFFSVKMFQNQKATVIYANQNVEATGILFEIREALISSCTDNFGGLERGTSKNKIEVIKDVRRFEDGSQKISKIYPIGQAEGETFSKTGLSIDNYNLSPRVLGSSKKVEEGTHLNVEFLRGFDQSKFEKQIRIYTLINDGRIFKCSLSPFIGRTSTWNLAKNYLYYATGDVAIGTEKFLGQLTISGGLFVEKGVSVCSSSEDNGLLSYDETSRTWKVCRDGGLVSLQDQRSPEI